MLEFLEREEIKKSKGSPIYFEVDYALNICKQKEKEQMDELQRKRLVAQRMSAGGGSAGVESENEIAKLREQILVQKKAQIIIYAILNHFDKAVKIALECRDVDMAKQYANKPEDKKVKKKLWMKIAKYLFNY